MSRYYMHCPQCRKRMKRYTEDVDGERLFYFCRNCGYRCTYLWRMNGMSEDWPKEIFDKAVQDGVITKNGKVI